MKKLVLISGSGRGLGSSIARSFISSGYRVAINYMKSEEQAHNLSNELGENALAFKADISDKSQVISMLNDIEDSFNDSPSILVNNAMTDYVFNGDARKFADEISWNVGTNLVQNPVVPYHDYTIAKAALLGLTRTFAKDLGGMGITVNMVSGGLLKVTDASAATPDAVFDAIAEMTPLQKVTTTEDFSDAVLFFASDNSRAITGQNLTVDGGLTFN